MMTWKAGNITHVPSLAPEKQLREKYLSRRRGVVNQYARSMRAALRTLM